MLFELVYRERPVGSRRTGQLKLVRQLRKQLLRVSEGTRLLRGCLTTRIFLLGTTSLIFLLLVALS